MPSQIGAAYGRLVGLLVLFARPLFAADALGGEAVASLGSGASASSAKSNSAAFAGPGAYALVGAVSFLGGVTGAHISLIVILLEVTKTSAALVLPFLLSLAISKLLSARTHAGGFYDALIRRKKVPYFFDETPVSTVSCM